MPGAAHHRDALEAFRRGGANALAHVRLALLLFERHRLVELRAQRSHHLVHRLEHLDVVAFT